MNLIINDQLVNYQEEGSGKTVVLLHGWGTNLNTFNDLANLLSERYHIVRLDFPGFGQSPLPKTDWHIEDYSKLVHDFLLKLKIEKPFAIIGHSFGGRAVIKGAAKGYLKPEKVILIGSAGVKPKKGAKDLAYKSIAKFGKTVTSLPIINKLQPALRKKLYQSIGNTDYIESKAMKQIFLNTINEDLLPDVKKIPQPVLLVWGKQDEETPLQDAKLMQERLRDSRLTIIDNAGHFVYLDKPIQVKEAIEGFLR